MKTKGFLPFLGIVSLAMMLPAAALAAGPLPLFPALPYPGVPDSLEAAVASPALLPSFSFPPYVHSGTAPVITTQPASQSVAIGASVTFTAAATGTPAPMYQWFMNGRFIRGANAATYTLSAASVGAAGAYTVEVYNGAGFATSDVATLSVAKAGTVTAAPQSQTIATGATAVFSVTAAGSGLTYQWNFDGFPISGATAASYTLANAGPGASGTFTVAVSSGSTVIAEETAELSVVTDARLTNLSARAQVGTGNNILIVGFASSGTGSKQILLRGVGPTLATAFDVSGALATPDLTLYGANGKVIASNSTWGGTSALMTAFSAVGAFALPANSADAALLEALATGTYTAQVTGLNGATGVALAEIYDADTGTPTANLVNVSARGEVVSGSGVLIAGFAIAGPTSETVLIRGVGPSLHSVLGFPNPIAGTQVTLYNSAGTQITANAGWGNDPWITGTSSQVGAFPLDPYSGDSALLVTLPPGNYSAQVAGVSGASGVGMVEVYEVR